MDEEGNNELEQDLPKQATCSSVPSNQWDNADSNTTVAGMQVPLQRLDMGRWKYEATKLNDVGLELFCEHRQDDRESNSALYITCNKRGVNGAAPAATFRLCGISAARLFLDSVVPGSLESMVARLVLETERPIEYTLQEEECDHQSTEPNDGETGDTLEQENLQQSSRLLNVRIVVMTASVYQAGDLRDVLLLQRGGGEGEGEGEAGICLDTLLSPEDSREIRIDEQESNVSSLESDPSSTNNNNSTEITFTESLPLWVKYIPWWIYSRYMRVSIQNLIFFYSFFSIIWAFWQLYRNVHIIQDVMEPILAALRTYLSSVMMTFDWLLAIFTDIWMKFLSPLTILQSFLLTPFVQVMIHLNAIFAPIVQVMCSLCLAMWNCLPNAQLWMALKNVFTVIYSFVSILGWSLWTSVVVLTRPLYYVWQSILNSRIAVASLDFNRLKISWVYNLVVGSLRTILKGMGWLFGYTSAKQKQKKARKHPSRYFSSPSVGKLARSAHYHSPHPIPSPLTKTNS